MFSITLSQKTLSSANSVYNSFCDTEIPLNKNGNRVLPTSFTEDDYLDSYIADLDLDAMKLPYVTNSGKQKYALTATENSILHFILSNAYNTYKDLTSHMLIYTTDMTQFRGSNYNQYDFSMPANDYLMIKNFIDISGKHFTFTGPSDKFLTAIGMQFLNMRTTGLSLEECDALYSTIDLSSSTITDGKFLTASTFYKCNISIGQGAVITGCRFYDCTFTFTGGTIVINDNNANASRATIFNNCVVPETMKNALIDRNGVPISSKIK